jgi:hypothetical protein
MAEEVKVQHGFSDSSILRVTASVVEVKPGELSVHLDIQSELDNRDAKPRRGQDSNHVSTTCNIAPGDVIRVKVAKAGRSGEICTIDVRVEKLGEKGDSRVHVFDFASRKFGNLIRMPGGKEKK